jgi:hypothetical protein
MQVCCWSKRLVAGGTRQSFLTCEVRSIVCVHADAAIDLNWHPGSAYDRSSKPAVVRRPEWKSGIERCPTATILVGTTYHMTIEQERSGDSGFVQDSEPCCCQNVFISFQEGKMSAIDSHGYDADRDGRLTTLAFNASGGHNAF